MDIRCRIWRSRNARYVFCLFSLRLWLICYFVDIFLQMNDQINSVLNRYEAFKMGDYSAAANPVPAEFARYASRYSIVFRGTNCSLSTSRMQDSSLIDLDDPPNATTPTGNPVDDLADLFGPSSASQTAAPAQQTRMFNTMQQPVPQTSNGSSNANALSDLFSNNPSPPPNQLSPGHSTFGSISLPMTPGPQAQQNRSQARDSPYGTSSPSFTPPTQPEPQGTFWAMQQGGSTGIGVQIQPQRSAMPPMASTSQTTIPAGTKAQAQSKDPFADLAGLF